MPQELPERPLTPPEPDRRALSSVADAPPAPETEPERETASPADDVPKWLRHAIGLFFMWAIGLLIAYWVLSRLHVLIVMFVVALFLSLAMEPPVNALARRGWRRGSATGVVVLVVLIVTVGFVAAFGSVVFTQISELASNTGHYVRNVVRFMNREFGLGIDARDLIKELQSPHGAVAKFGRDLSNQAGDIALGVASALFQIGTTFIFAFYLTADGPKFRRTICSRLPRARQEIVLEAWELAVDKTGAYLYSRAIQALASTVCTWVFLFALGVPSSLALAIWVGVVSQFIPTVGTYIAMVLPVLVTLVSQPIDTLPVLAFLILYQQFENYVIGPRIARYTLKIHPALTIGTVVAGGLLFGGVGALLALPATAVIQALLSTYTEEKRVIDSELTKEPKVRRRRWRVWRGLVTRMREHRKRTEEVQSG